MVRLSLTLSNGKVDGLSVRQQRPLRGTRMGLDHQTAPGPAASALGNAETVRLGGTRIVKRPASTCGQRATAASESAGDAPAGGPGAGMVKVDRRRRCGHDCCGFIGPLRYQPSQCCNAASTCNYPARALCRRPLTRMTTAMLEYQERN